MPPASVPENVSDAAAALARQSWTETKDRAARTAAARAARWRGYEHAVDPDGRLDPAERARLAREAQLEHMRKMTEAAAARRVAS